MLTIIWIYSIVSGYCSQFKYTKDFCCWHYDKVDIMKKKKKPIPTLVNNGSDTNISSNIKLSSEAKETHQKLRRPKSFPLLSFFYAAHSFLNLSQGMSTLYYAEYFSSDSVLTIVIPYEFSSGRKLSSLIRSHLLQKIFLWFVPD